MKYWHGEKKVRYTGERKGNIIPGKVYEVMAEERGGYFIIDESGEEKFYSRVGFMVVELCPCCEKTMVSSFDECPVCGWVNDYGSNLNPDERDMPNNDLSLNEARAYFRKTGKPIPYEGTYYKKMHSHDEKQ